MRRSNEQKREAFSVGQLARRWSVSPERIRKLIERGLLFAFRIPSAGKYGETVKVPRQVVMDTEQSWAVVPSQPTMKKPPRRRGGSLPALRHFPELNATTEPDAEYPEDDQR